MLLRAICCTGCYLGVTESGIDIAGHTSDFLMQRANVEIIVLLLPQIYLVLVYRTKGPKKYIFLTKCEGCILVKVLQEEQQRVSVGLGEDLLLRHLFSSNCFPEGFQV